jgi:hypothetical protein
MKAVSKSLLDPNFEYRSAANTDVRLTFERVRREQQALRAGERHPPKVAAISGKILPTAGSAEACAGHTSGSSGDQEEH